MLFLGAMKNESTEEAPPIPEAVLHDLAKELQRLANHITKNIREKSTLKGLSHLTAMQPIQRMLMDQLSNDLYSSDQSKEKSQVAETTSPGYL